MEIKISRDIKTLKWTLTINDEVITAQVTLGKLFHKAWKYAKSQEI